MEGGFRGQPSEKAMDQSASPPDQTKARRQAKQTSTSKHAHRKKHRRVQKIAKWNRQMLTAVGKARRSARQIRCRANLENNNTSVMRIHNCVSGVDSATPSVDPTATSFTPSVEPIATSFTPSVEPIATSFTPSVDPTATSSFTPTLTRAQIKTNRLSLSKALELPIAELDARLPSPKIYRFANPLSFASPLSVHHPVVTKLDFIMQVWQSQKTVQATHELVDRVGLELACAWLLRSPATEPVDLHLQDRLIEALDRLAAE